MFQVEGEVEGGRGGAQTNPLPHRKQDTSALWAHLNGSASDSSIFDDAARDGTVPSAPQSVLRNPC